MVGEKGNEATNVTGPNGEPVRGSPYAADRRSNYRKWYPRGGRGGRGGPRRPRGDNQVNKRQCCYFKHLHLERIGLNILHFFIVLIMEK